MIPELRDYQKAIVGKILTQDNVLIVAPMGAGKTLSTLTALTALIVRGSVKNALIIAPKRVAMSVWVQEVSNWDMGLNIRFCKTALDVKLFLLEPVGHHIAVCSVTRIDEIPHGCWDCVVLDESTLFKHKQSNRSKEARRICRGVKHRIELSGTPVHNGYEGLWHQCFLLDGGKALGHSLTEFRQRYCREKYRVNGVVTVYETDPLRLPSLLADSKHLIHVVNNNVKLPPILYKDFTIDLPKLKLAQYTEFENNNVLVYENEFGAHPFNGETKTLMAFCRTSLGMKLRQFASGMLYTDESHSEYDVIHKAKIEALKDVAEGYDGGILVAYQFQSEYAELKKEFPKAQRLETDRDIEAWNRGDVPMALVHPASVGHGLNLQFGGHVLVWFSLTYDAELYAQLNKRLHRSGQTETVSVVHLITRHTIDEKILKVLQRKEQNAETLLTV